MTSHLIKNVRAAFADRQQVPRRFLRLSPLLWANLHPGKKKPRLSSMVDFAIRIAQKSLQEGSPLEMSSFEALCESELRGSEIYHSFCRYLPSERLTSESQLQKYHQRLMEIHEGIETGRKINRESLAEFAETEFLEFATGEKGCNYFSNEILESYPSYPAHLHGAGGKRFDQLLIGLEVLFAMSRQLEKNPGGVYQRYVEERSDGFWVHPKKDPQANGYAQRKNILNILRVSGQLLARDFIALPKDLEISQRVETFSSMIERLAEQNNMPVAIMARRNFLPFDMSSSAASSAPAATTDAAGVGSPPVEFNPSKGPATPTVEVEIQEGRYPFRQRPKDRSGFTDAEKCLILTFHRRITKDLPKATWREEKEKLAHHLGFTSDSAINQWVSEFKSKGMDWTEFEIPPEFSTLATKASESFARIQGEYKGDEKPSTPTRTSSESLMETGESKFVSAAHGPTVLQITKKGGRKYFCDYDKVQILRHYRGLKKKEKRAFLNALGIQYDSNLGNWKKQLEDRELDWANDPLEIFDGYRSAAEEVQKRPEVTDSPSPNKTKAEEPASKLRITSTRAPQGESLTSRKVEEESNVSHTGLQQVEKQLKEEKTAIEKLRLIREEALKRQEEMELKKKQAEVDNLRAERQKIIEELLGLGLTMEEIEPHLPKETPLEVSKQTFVEESPVDNIKSTPEAPPEEEKKKELILEFSKLFKKRVQVLEAEEDQKKAIEAQKLAEIEAEKARVEKEIEETRQAEREAARKKALAKRARKEAQQKQTPVKTQSALSSPPSVAPQATDLLPQPKDPSLRVEDIGIENLPDDHFMEV